MISLQFTLAMFTHRTKNAGRSLCGSAVGANSQICSTRGWSYGRWCIHMVALHNWS